ncbi:MAG: hypothetical protein WD512_08790, partial [Candidatus Paceibacterota bacterium]
MLLDPKLGQLSLCAKFINFFPAKDHPKIADILIKERKPHDLLPYLEDFQNIDRLNILKQLLRVTDLPEFRNITVDIVDYERENISECIGDNIKQFLDLDHNQIAEVFIQNNASKYLKFFITKLKNLNTEVQDSLTNLGAYEIIASSPSSFKNLNQKEFAIRLINDFAEARLLFKNFDKFTEVDFQDIIDQVFKTFDQCQADQSKERRSAKDLRILSYPSGLSLLLGEDRRLPEKYALSFCAGSSSNVIFKTYQDIDNFPIDEAIKIIAQKGEAASLFSDSCPFKDFRIDQALVDSIIEGKGNAPNLIFLDSKFAAFYTEGNISKIIRQGNLS